MKISQWLSLPEAVERLTAEVSSLSKEVRALSQRLLPKSPAPRPKPPSAPSPGRSKSLDDSARTGRVVKFGPAGTRRLYYPPEQG